MSLSCADLTRDRDHYQKLYEEQVAMRKTFQEKEHVLRARTAERDSLERLVKEAAAAAYADLSAEAQARDDELTALYTDFVASHPDPLHSTYTSKGMRIVIANDLDDLGVSIAWEANPDPNTTLEVEVYYIHNDDLGKLWPTLTQKGKAADLPSSTEVIRQHGAPLPPSQLSTDRREVTRLGREGGWTFVVDVFRNGNLATSLSHISTLVKKSPRAATATESAAVAIQQIDEALSRIRATLEQDAKRLGLTKDEIEARRTMMDKLAGIERGAIISKMYEG
jgi:hypothetical protein